MFGVVGRKVQVLVSVRLLPVQCGLHTAIFLSGGPKKGMLLFSSSSRVKMMLPVGSTVFMCCCNLFAFPVCTRQMTSSTYRFQFLGWQSTGAVAITFCSRSSMYRFTTMGDNFSSKSEICRLQDLPVATPSPGNLNESNVTLMHILLVVASPVPCAPFQTYHIGLDRHLEMCLGHHTTCR